MPSKGLRPGSRYSEAYELVARETSIDLPKTSSTSQSSENDDEERTSLHRRPQSRSDREPTGEEALGLLSRAPLDFRKRFQLSGGLRIALELITQSTPSLLCAVVGSVMTGVVFDQVQFWPQFTKIGELFILVPVLLNLKGCLEMNLASRLSTSVRIFLFGY
jgi:hypothetical protein